MPVLEEPKYKFLINKREKTRINFNNDPNAFIEYSNSRDDILPIIEDYNKKGRRKVLIIFDDMIHMLCQTKKHKKFLKIYLLGVEN